MKPLLLAALVGLLPVSETRADQAEKSPAERILDATDFCGNGFESARSTFKPVIDQFRQQGLDPKAIEEIESAADAFFHKVMSDSSLKAEAIKLYNKNFTTEELEELLAFYETPLGQKTLVQLPAILRESMALGQKIAEKHAPSFQQQLGMILNKHKKIVPEALPEPAVPSPAKP